MNWQHDRTMTPEQYAWALDQLNLTRPAAGRYLGISARTSYRYGTGESLIPAAHVLLLRALIAGKWKPVVPRWHKGQN